MKTRHIPAVEIRRDEHILIGSAYVGCESTREKQSGKRISSAGDAR